MTEYCIWGSTEPFKTMSDFRKALRNQVYGKTEHSFYNRNFPLSYFNFTWRGGYIVINFYNTRTKREVHKCLHYKDLSYSLFTELLEGLIAYILPKLYEYPKPPKKNFWEWLWSLIKPYFGIKGQLHRCDEFISNWGGVLIEGWLVY